MRRKAIMVMGLLLTLAMTLSAQSVNLRLRNVRVKKAISELKASSGYSFVYSSEDLNTEKTVNINAKTLKEAIDQILQGQDVNYEIDGKNIIVKKKQKETSNQGAKQQKYSGVIIDANGLPVIGAAVVIQGTSTGVTTDTDGRFEIQAPANTVFEVSCIGYETQQIKGSSKMNIVLAEDVEMIDETVIIGYGSVKKSNLTGAVASVKMDKVEKTGSVDVANALMGRVAGLDVMQTAVSPDASYSMVIRGQASTGAGNTPIYVIDGFPGGDINSINPNDIESIEVLKDASSTSIYGSRAANGVILVTTKKGKEGTAVVNFKAYGSLQRIENPYNIMEAGEYMQVVNDYYQEKWLYDNKIAPYGNVAPSTVTKQPTFPFTSSDMANVTNTDYWDLMTRTGMINEEDISISGGTDKTHYLMSFGHYRQDGVMKNSDHEKFMFRVNMDYKFNKWLTTGVTASGTRSIYNKLQTSGNSDNLSIIN